MHKIKQHKLFQTPLNVTTVLSEEFKQFNTLL